MFLSFLLVVPLYIASDDYTAVSSQPVTFSSAPDQMCVTISISDDGVVEETELFAVTLVSEDPTVQLTLPNASIIIMDRSSKYTPFVHSVGKHRISLGVLVSVHSCNACMHSWTQL